MISSNDFRTGTTIELDGQVWRVVEFLHVKPGKGSAFVRTKLKGVQSGNVVEKTFRAGETMPQAQLEKEGALKQRRLGALGTVETSASVDSDDGDEEPEERPAAKEKE